MKATSRREFKRDFDGWFIILGVGALLALLVLMGIIFL